MKYIKNEDNYFGLINGNKVNLNSTKIEELKYIDSIEKLRPGLYDFSKVNFIKNNVKVTLICKKHNIEFTQVRTNTKKYNGCPECKKENQSVDKEHFINKALVKHGSKYDYSLVEYVNAYTPVKIICKTHGVFYQRPGNHINGQNCINCVLEKIRKKEASIVKDPKGILKNIFIKKVENKFGKNKYNFDKVVYNGRDIPVTISCVIHGDFNITPHRILRRESNGCKKCNNNSEERKNTYIEKAIMKHGDKYDYTEINMNETYNRFYCRVHMTYFTQSRRNHLCYSGCKLCYTTNQVLTNERFIEIAKHIWGEETYDYSKIKYVGCLVPITINCPKHGDFYKIPNEFIRRNGRANGCQLCSASTGEQKIATIFNNLKIDYIKEYSIGDLSYKYDFYLPDFNTIIEYHGGQHYIETNFFKTDLKKQKERDSIKLYIAKENGYKYFIIPMTATNLRYEIISILNSLKYYKYNNKFYPNQDKLLEEIKSTENINNIDVNNYIFKIK